MTTDYTFSMATKDFFDLATAVNFASTDKQRLILNTVLFRAKAGESDLEVVATDSYRLLFIKRPTVLPFEEDFTFLMSTDDLKSVVKIFNSYLTKNLPLTFTLDKGEGTLNDPSTLRVGSETANWPCDEIQGQYPSIDHLVPKAEGVGSKDNHGFYVGVNIEFIASLLKIAGFEPGKKTKNYSQHKTSVIAHLAGPTTPFIIESQDGLSTALFMPIRLDR